MTNSSHSSEKTVPIHSDSVRASSGYGMDKKISTSRWTAKTISLLVLVLIGVGFIGNYLLQLSSGRTLTVDQQKITVSSVVSGTFDDFIPLRSRVTPFKTVYLDAIEGGRVDKRLVEDGTMVKAGDLIVIMSNTSLQLDVTRNEAMVAEQLNNMRTIELQLEQNRLQHKRNLVEINYQIKRLGRQVDRQQELSEKGLAIESQLEDTEDSLEYYRQRQELTLESQATDANMQETQLKFLRSSGARLQENVEIARTHLDSLNVRAPVDGKLSGFDVEVGQSISRGGRLGQIDDPSHFKLRTSIDEYYLGRVDIGQVATFTKDGNKYQLQVAKIFPDVKNGEFLVDLYFDEAEPQNIRRGQTIQTRLTLGDSTPALIIPNGAFFQDTGGNWIFVVSADESQAVKRTVKLGRRNTRYIEVLEGLEKGEKVITSPYSSFKNIDRLQLDNNES